MELPSPAAVCSAYRLTPIAVLLSSSRVLIHPVDCLLLVTLPKMLPEVV